jgi:hypothetical protein
MENKNLSQDPKVVENQYTFGLPESLQFESGIKSFALRMPSASESESIYDNTDDINTPLDINKEYFYKMLLEVDGKPQNAKQARALWRDSDERTQEMFVFAVSQLVEPLQTETMKLLKDVSTFHATNEKSEPGVFYKFEMPDIDDYADLVDFKTITLRGLKVFEVDDLQKSLQKETNMIKAARILFLKMATTVDDDKLDASNALVFWSKLPERYRRLVMIAIDFVRRPTSEDLSDFLSQMTVKKNEG